MPGTPQDVTQLLAAWRQGDQSALNKLMPLVYRDLRRLAQHHFRQERKDHTLQATALIHETYLRLIDQSQVNWKDRAHFFGIASHLMREILVDYARKRKAAKRGGGAKELNLDEAVFVSPEQDPDLAILDDALQRLEEIDPEQSKIVELRFFGGLTIEETAHALNCSVATVKRKWQLARIWLFHMIRKGETGESSTLEASE